jgi:FKBP-type peptidyl-prolyl cis-trans isomerase FkpA
MKKQFMFLALASLGLGLASCNGGFKQSPGGQLYEIHSTKDNPKIQVGDYVFLNLVAKTDGDSILFSTYDSGQEIHLVEQKPQSKADIFAGLQLFAEGDSATLKIPADSVFKKPNQRPPSFKGNFLVYDIKIEKVIAKGKLSDKDFSDKITTYLKTMMANLKNQEPVKIKNYIAHEKLNGTQTADSLYYQITKPGVGPNAAPGDTVVVNYVGRFLNGKVFDTSIKDTAVADKKYEPMHPYKAIHVVAAGHQMIPGWDEALLLLNKGAVATIVMPSKLAYGANGMQIIGPYTPISFTLQVVDIIHPNPNAPKPAAVNPLMMQQMQQQMQQQQAKQAQQQSQAPKK